MSELSMIKEQLASIKLLVADTERHLEAGGIAKANSVASNIEDASRKLFNMTYKLAFPDKCPHLSGKTEVHGGGWTCNKCGDFVDPRGYDT